MTPQRFRQVTTAYLVFTGLTYAAGEVLEFAFHAPWFVCVPLFVPAIAFVGFLTWALSSSSPAKSEG